MAIGIGFGVWEGAERVDRLLVVGVVRDLEPDHHLQGRFEAVEDSSETPRRLDREFDVCRVGATLQLGEQFATLPRRLVLQVDRGSPCDRRYRSDHQAPEALHHERDVVVPDAVHDRPHRPDAEV